MVVLAGAVLAMLVVFVRLLADDRDGTPLALSRPGRGRAAAVRRRVRGSGGPL